MRYGFILIFAIVSWLASFPAQEALAGNAEDLPGYSANRIVKAFAEKVKSDDDLYDYLHDHADLSRRVMGDTGLQSALAEGDVTVEDLAEGKLPTSASATADNAFRTGNSRAEKDLMRAVGRASGNSTAPLPDTTKIVKNPDTIPYVPPVIGGDGKLPVETPTPTPPVASSFDINEAGAADNSLDAKGWPKYLKVPADCPAPTASVKYYYENRFFNHFLNNPNANGFGPVGPAQNGQLGWNQIQPYHKVGPWFLIGMTDVEQFAIPFHTANTSGYTLELTSETHPVPETFFQIAYAHCPGDFTNATPAGEEVLKDGGRIGVTSAGATVLAIVADKNRPYPSSRILQLRPNKRYFINIRPIAAYEPDNDYGCDKHFPNIAKRDGHSICWRLLTGRSNSFEGNGSQSFANTPPYAGPCLTSPPYPENYDSETCGESRAQTCVEENGGNIDITCYDPTNDKAPQRFVRQCSNGRTMTWTVGYRKPAYSNYVCEYSNATVVNGICAAHREGLMRERTCTTSQGGVSSDYIEQCLFDRAEGRFHWVKLVANSGHASATSNMHCEIVPYERPLNSDVCRFDNKDYPIGTVQTVTCHRTDENRIATMTRTCQKLQAGSSSAGTSSAPLFVRTGGEPIPESEVTVLRPASCTFSYAQPGQ